MRCRDGAFSGFRNSATQDSACCPVVPRLVCRTRDLKFVSLCFDPMSPASPQLVDCACCRRLLPPAAAADPAAAVDFAASTLQLDADGSLSSGLCQGSIVLQAAERAHADSSNPLAPVQAPGTGATLRPPMEPSVPGF